MLAIFSTLKADFPDLKQCSIGMDIIPKSPPSALISESGNIAMIASSPVSTSDESCARISCPSFAPNQWNLKLFTLPKPITLKKMLRNPEKTFWTRWFSWLLGSANTFLAIRTSVTIRALLLDVSRLENPLGRRGRMFCCAGFALSSEMRLVQLL